MAGCGSDGEPGIVVKLAGEIAVVFALAGVTVIVPGYGEFWTPGAASPVISAHGIAGDVHPVEKLVMHAIAQGGVF